MQDNYKIIRLKKEDKTLTNQLLDTAAQIHNRKKDSYDWLNWKYFESPFGESICLLALKDNEIAGEVTFGKYEFLLNGVTQKCLISYQTMVHPQHQKKGLFSKLTKEILNIAEAEGIDLIFNFPNKASYTPFLRLNFIPINHLKNYISITNKLNFVKSPLSIKKPFFANSIEEFNKLELESFENLKETIQPLQIKENLVPNRTYAFLKWRYFTRPLYDYRIIKSEAGWAIVRLGMRGKLNEVQIMEIFPKEKHTASFLRSIKKEIQHTISPDIILMNISENHPINNPLKRVGFISLPHSISFFTFSLNKKISSYSTAKKWVITATEFHRY
jgi:GNAT superfamily N-acetyltransferase